MKAPLAIGLYILAVAILGALFAPWLFWAVQWASQFQALERIGEYPFHRVFNRALMIVALAGIWPLWRTLGIRSLADAGLRSRKQWWRDVGLGVACGVVSFLVAGLITIWLGYRDWRSVAVGGRIGKYLLSAVIVGIVEEIFFRGGIQGGFQRVMRIPVAVTLCSAIYSVVHYLKPTQERITPEAVNWLSGFDCLGQGLQRSAHEPGMAVGCATLLLAGMIMGWAFVRTKALYLSMGLHAGWVFTLKTYGYMTAATRKAGGVNWGAGDLKENIATWPGLVVLWLVLIWVYRKDNGPAPERLRASSR